MEKETKKANLDTMVGVGKTKTIAGREYTILPVTIKDMHYIIGDDEKNRLIIVEQEKLEKDIEAWHIFGLNITNEIRKKIFLEMVNKYVFYKDHPMTEELLVEHNWSFREIGEFLLTWCQLSD